MGDGQPERKQKGGKTGLALSVRLDFTRFDLVARERRLATSVGSQGHVTKVY